MSTPEIPQHDPTHPQESDFHAVGPFAAGMFIYQERRALSSPLRRVYGEWEKHEHAVDDLSWTVRQAIHDDSGPEGNIPQFQEIEYPWITHGQHLAMLYPSLDSRMALTHPVAAELRQKERGDYPYWAYSLRFNVPGTEIEWVYDSSTVRVKTQKDASPEFLSPLHIRRLAGLLLSPYCVAYDPRKCHVSEGSLMDNSRLG